MFIADLLKIFVSNNPENVKAFKQNSIETNKQYMANSPYVV